MQAGPVKIHSLKTIDWSWDAVWNGKKTFEVRKNDRDFKVGEWLDLVRIEADGREVPIRLPGREGVPAQAALLLVIIDYIMPLHQVPGLYTAGMEGHDPADYVVMSIRRL